jgi:hypothetical protein
MLKQKFKIHNKMRVLHFSRSLKIMVLYKNEDIIFLFTLTLHYIYTWHHVNVFQKYNTQMLCKCKCQNMFYKKCKCNNLSMKMQSINFVIYLYTIYSFVYLLICLVIYFMWYLLLYLFVHSFSYLIMCKF